MSNLCMHTFTIFLLYRHIMGISEIYFQNRHSKIMQYFVLYCMQIIFSGDDCSNQNGMNIF